MNVRIGTALEVRQMPATVFELGLCRPEKGAALTDIPSA
jgi:hypothetical protein